MGSRLALVGLAAVLTACGAVAENAIENVAEQAAERAIEQETGQSVDLDMETSDGSMSFNVETEDGSEQLTIGSGEIPEGFPVPFPDGTEVVAVVTMGAGSGMVTGSLPAEDFENVVQFYTDHFSAYTDVVASTGADFASWVSTEAGGTVTVNVAEDGTMITAIAGEA